MRHWSVGGGIITCADSVLMVNNLRKSGLTDWTTPGGVIDPGETMVEGLTREVAEETGLVVARWDGPVYTVEAQAVDMGWQLRVEAHRSLEHTGDLTVDDPDGIVIDARWVQFDELGDLLDGHIQWFVEPLLTYMSQPSWSQPPHFGYRVRGTKLGELSVERAA